MRRGLTGEGIFRLAARLGINPDRVVISLQTLSYGTFFAFSLREAGYMNLKAAIASLAVTPAQGYEFTKTYIEKGNCFVNYPLASLLAGFAFVPVRARLAAIFTPVTTTLLCFSLAGTAVLLMVAADWGRFLDVLVISLFLLSFLPPEKPAPFRAVFWLVALLLPALFAYASFWHFPPSGKANPFNTALFRPYD